MSHLKAAEYPFCSITCGTFTKMALTERLRGGGRAAPSSLWRAGLCQPPPAPCLDHLAAPGSCSLPLPCQIRRAGGVPAFIQSLHHNCQTALPSPPPGGEAGKRGWDGGMRWFSFITSSMDMSLSELTEIEKDREAWRSSVHRVTKSSTWLSDWTATTTPPPDLPSFSVPQFWPSQTT